MGVAPVAGGVTPKDYFIKKKALLKRYLLKEPLVCNRKIYFTS